MKIYLAATAPGNEMTRERGMLSIDRRLLSYFLILHKQLECNTVFKTIINENLFSNMDGGTSTRGSLNKKEYEK